MKKTRGFTLVELLVVIAIIGILVGLLLPAVQAMRERTRSMKCSNRVRQLAMAALQHETAKGRMPGYIQKFGVFPGASAVAPDPTDTGNNGGAVPRHVKIGGYGVALLPYMDSQATFEMWSQDRYPVISNGAGDYKATARLSGIGFHALAAPNLPTFQCPSNPNRDGSHGLNSYTPNNGMCHIRLDATAGAMQIIGLAAAESRHNGVFNAKYVGDRPAAAIPLYCNRQVGPDVTLDDIKDGKANTMLFGENAQAYPWHRPGFLDGGDLLQADLTREDIAPSQAMMLAKFTNGLVWHYEDRDAGKTPPVLPDLPAYSCAGVSSPSTIPALTVQDIHKINSGGRAGPGSLFTRVMASADCFDLARPSSAHVDGFNASFADGATRWISASIDYRVYQATMTTRGKSSNVPFPEFILTDEIEQ